MIGGDAEELVEIEGRRAREVHLAVRVQRAELVIQPDRRAPGRQAEHECRLSPQRRRDVRAPAPSPARARPRTVMRLSLSISRFVRRDARSRRALRQAPDAPRRPPARRPAGTSGCAARPAAGGATAPLRSHGTARKMPPESTNGNSAADQVEPPRDRHARRLELVGGAAQDPDRDRVAVAEGALHALRERARWPPAAASP